MAASVITEHLMLEPSLVQNAGDQVETPQRRKLNSTYRFSKWQYKTKIDNDSDWEIEVSALLEKLRSHSEFLEKIESTGGKNLIYITATDFAHKAYEMDIKMMESMCKMKISFGFEFFNKQWDGES
jgi:hypothetical protein